MSLFADSSNPCLVRPVFAPPTSLSFRIMEAVPSGKTNIPGTYFPYQQFIAEEQCKFLHKAFSWKPDLLYPYGPSWL